MCECLESNSTEALWAAALWQTTALPMKIRLGLKLYHVKHLAGSNFLLGASLVNILTAVFTFTPCITFVRVPRVYQYSGTIGGSTQVGNNLTK